MKADEAIKAIREALNNHVPYEDESGIIKIYLHDFGKALAALDSLTVDDGPYTGPVKITTPDQNGEYGVGSLDGHHCIAEGLTLGEALSLKARLDLLAAKPSEDLRGISDDAHRIGLSFWRKHFESGWLDSKSDSIVELRQELSARDERIRRECVDDLAHGSWGNYLAIHLLEHLAGERTINRPEDINIPASEVPRLLEQAKKYERDLAVKHAAIMGEAKK